MPNLKAVDLEPIERIVTEMGPTLARRMSELTKMRTALEEIAETTSDPGIERMARAALEE